MRSNCEPERGGAEVPTIISTIGALLTQCTYGFRLWVWSSENTTGSPIQNQE